jgi:UDP-3-O-[3-hydroxymyristoyl] glucosamine N-acyltransferase
VGKTVLRSYTVSQLANALGASFLGDGQTTISGVASLDSAVAGDLTFFSDAKHHKAAVACAASVMILREADANLQQCARIVHPAPHTAFAEALDLLFPVPQHVANVSERAYVAPTASVDGARIEPLASVGDRSIVGAGSTVHSQAHIGEDVIVGKDCVLHPGARLLTGVRIGDRCIIHSGVVLGADGFGFQPSPKGWRKVAQVGAVIVGDDVEIGANTTIDRGAIEDTVIGNGVKIDNLVQIAHNVRIGEHTAIAACAGIAGSAVIGARCMIGGAAMIAGHLSICDDVVVSGGTLVPDTINTPGRYTGVFPVTTHRDWTKIAARLRRSLKSPSK